MKKRKVVFGQLWKASKIAHKRLNLLFPQISFTSLCCCLIFLNRFQPFASLWIGSLRGRKTEEFRERSSHREPFRRLTCCAIKPISDRYFTVVIYSNRLINRLCFLCLSATHWLACSLSTNRLLIRFHLETKIRKVNGLRRIQENQLPKSPTVRFKFSPSHFRHPLHSARLPAL